MTSIEIRVRDLYDDLNDSEKKAASFFLSHVDSVFVLNALMDYLLVLCAARLAGIPLRRRRYLLAGLGAAVQAHRL